MTTVEDLLRRAGTPGLEPLFYALTPPRLTTPAETVEQLAARTLARLAVMGVDGLVLYDLVDESDRTQVERPFPFLQTRDPGDYLAGPLADWQGPTILYRCVGGHDADALGAWFDRNPAGSGTVLVGAATATKAVRTTLPDAQRLHAHHRPGAPLGGVTIPERHASGGAEHERLLAKQAAGCRFFVSQVVYDVGAAKDLASDYAYACRAAGVDPVPLVFTLSLCGSDRTLDFLRWLGVEIPRWVANEMIHADDTLAASLAHCLQSARELTDFCRYLRLPFGFNVESVSTRRVEIEATVELARAVGDIVRA